MSSDDLGQEPQLRSRVVSRARGYYGWTLLEAAKLGMFKRPALKAHQQTAIASALSRSSMTSESSIDLAVPPARFRNLRARASSATTSDAPFAMLLTKGQDFNLAA